jgi:hypothetical protein
MNDERAHAWIMRAKGGYKLGVPAELDHDPMETVITIAWND